MQSAQAQSSDARPGNRPVLMLLIAAEVVVVVVVVVFLSSFHIHGFENGMIQRLFLWAYTPVTLT